MSFATFVVVLTLFWAAIHAVHRALAFSKAQSILPIPRTTTNLRPNQRRVWNTSTTQVVLKSFHLRIQTTAWNVTHDVLAIAFKQGQQATRVRMLTYFYDLGTILGVMGMFSALLLLSVTAGTTALSVKDKLWASPVPILFFDGLGTLHLAKRSLDISAFDPTPAPQSDPWIKPIVSQLTPPKGEGSDSLSFRFLASQSHSHTSPSSSLPCSSLKWCTSLAMLLLPLCKMLPSSYTLTIPINIFSGNPYPSSPPVPRSS